MGVSWAQPSGRHTPSVDEDHDTSGWHIGGHTCTWNTCSSFLCHCCIADIFQLMLPAAWNLILSAIGGRVSGPSWETTSSFLTGMVRFGVVQGLEGSR